MKRYRFKKIDAFATLKSEGNPAGYIWLDSLSDISPKEMLQIGKELKGFVNEVGFIFQKSDNEFDLKYFSSEREVDFCGHATIAIMYDLAKNNKGLQQVDLFHINTNRGELVVENRITNEDSVFIMSPEPVEKQFIPHVQKLAGKLKISPDEMDGTCPISVINAGLSTLIVPIRTLHSILSISPNFEELKDFCIT
jgi:PhzF family phenazine biosynthesis protein